MKKIHHILIIIIILILSCNNPKREISKTKVEFAQIDIHRIDFLLKVKQGVAEKYWTDYGKRKLSGTIHYFTFNSEYLINPSEYLSDKLTDFKAINLPKKFNLLTDMNILYRKNQDTAMNFNMATTIEYFDTTDIHYNNPIAYCSDLNIIHSFINDITDLEDWSTMVIHETFHLYQYTIPAFRNQIENLINNDKYISQEALGKIFKENTWFANSVRKENNLLLSALSETNPDEIKKSIDLFLKIRANRRTKYLKDHNYDIAPIECLNEAFEGGARYIEFNTKMYLKKSAIDKELLSVDTCYNSNQTFLNYNLENDKGLCYPDNKYFYATGFNMIKLLEKLDIDFKNDLYSKSPLFLEYYFKEHITN